MTLIQCLGGALSFGIHFHNRKGFGLLGDGDWPECWLHLTLPSGMQIDFGGIGKEYAVDRTAALLVAEVAGVRSQS